MRPTSSLTKKRAEKKSKSAQRRSEDANEVPKTKAHLTRPNLAEKVKEEESATAAINKQTIHPAWIKQKAEKGNERRKEGMPSNSLQDKSVKGAKIGQCTKWSKSSKS